MGTVYQVYRLRSHASEFSHSRHGDIKPLPQAHASNHAIISPQYCWSSCVSCRSTSRGRFSGSGQCLWPDHTPSSGLPVPKGRGGSAPLLGADRGLVNNESTARMIRPTNSAMPVMAVTTWALHDEDACAPGLSFTATAFASEVLAPLMRNGGVFDQELQAGSRAGCASNNNAIGTFTSDLIKNVRSFALASPNSAGRCWLVARPAGVSDPLPESSPRVFKTGHQVGN